MPYEDNPMDPNLIHLDWERTFDALMIVIVFAFLVERALAVIFENELYIRNVDRPGLKELLAIALSIAICFIWKFDALRQDRVRPPLASV